MGKRILVDEIYQNAEAEAREYGLSRSLAEQENLRFDGDPERLRLDEIARQRAAEWAETEFSEPLREIEDQAPAGLQFAAE